MPLIGTANRVELPVVGRIAKYVHAEDYVINGNRLAVGEGHSLTELESVGNGFFFVIVFGDRAVRSTGIGIGVTVVLPASRLRCLS